MLSKSRAKTILATIAITALSVSLISPAAEAAPLINRGSIEWNTLPGTVALRAALDKNDAYLATLNDLHLSMVIHEVGSSGDATETTTVEATKTAAVAHYQWLDNETGDKTKFDYFYNNNNYIESIESFQTGPIAVNDITATLKRLNKTNVVAVNDHTSTKLSGLPDISPVSTWANAERNLFSSLAGTTDISYSEVSSAPDTTDPTSTVYSWEGQYTLTLGTIVGVHLLATETFNADGLITAVHLEQNSPPYYSLTIDQTITPVAPQTLVFPAAKDTIDLGTLVNMGFKIDAEKSLAKKAASIVAKAKTLAKKASKGKVSATQLASAAKTLKIGYKASKTGIKISAVVKQVTGSLCIVAVGGKTSIAPCN